MFASAPRAQTSSFVRIPARLWDAVAAAFLICGGICPEKAAALSWSPAAPLNQNAAYDNGTDFNPRVATDGAGNWVAVWKSTYPVANDDTDGANDFMVSRSSDDGLNWSAPASLSSDYASTPTLSDVRLVHAGGSNWVAAWSAWLGGTYGTDLDVVYVRSTDHGVSWSAPAILNGDAAGDSTQDFLTDLASDGVGNVLAAIQQDTYDFFLITGDCSVIRSSNSGASWSARVQVNPVETQSYADRTPRLASLGSGNWCAVWSSDTDVENPGNIDRDLWRATSSDNGASWSAPSLLHPAPASDTAYDNLEDLKADGNTLICVSSTFNNNDNIPIYYWRSTDSGASWSEPVQLSNPYVYPAPSANYLPQLLATGGTRWNLLWASNDSLGNTVGSDNDILLSRSTDDGSTWATPAALAAYAESDTVSDYEPVVGGSASGTCIALWTNGGSAPGAHGSDGEIAIARSTDHGATWSEASILNSSHAVSDSGDDDLRPNVAADGEGTAMAVWSTTGLSDADIRIARSLDDGATWGNPAELQTDATLDERTDSAPDLVHAGGNAWVAAWSTSGGAYGTEGDILSARSTDQGISWSAPQPIFGSPLSDDTGEQNVRLAANDAGSVMAVWQATPSPFAPIGGLTVHAAFSSNSGASWGAATAVSNVTASTSTGSSPHVVHTGGAKWLAAWHSNNPLSGTTGNDIDILFARSSDNGSVWTATAALNSTATSDSTSDVDVSLASDGNGNVVAVWQRSSFSVFDEKAPTPSLPVLSARSSDHGATWNSVETVTTVPASFASIFPSPDPQVHSAGNGRFLIVYASTDVTNYPDIDADLYYCESQDNGATWSTGMLINSRGITDKASDVRQSICAGQDRWIAVWEFHPAAPDRPYGSDVDAFYSVTEFGAGGLSGAADWELFE